MDLGFEEYLEDFKKRNPQYPNVIDMQKYWNFKDGQQRSKQSM